jgi:hypothetical protein
MGCDLVAGCVVVPRTYQTFRKDEMTDQTADTSRRPRLDLSAAQVTGGALAAVTSAVAGSTLGVNGTVAGAAVGSVVATVGGELYTHSLRRTHQSVRGVVTRPSQGAAQTRDMSRDTAANEPAPTQELPGSTTGDEPAPTQELPRGTAPEESTPKQELSPRTAAQLPEIDDVTRVLHPTSRRPPSDPGGRSLIRRWALVGAAAAGVFALSMGALSVGEVIAGRPVASVVTGEPGSGTTLGTTFGGSADAQVNEPNPTESQNPSGTEPEQSTPRMSPTPQSSPSPSTQPNNPGQSDSQTPVPRSTSSPAPTSSSVTP